MLATAHDAQIRSLLKAHLGARTNSGDRVVDELLLAYGEVRADVALVNGHLEGFEIKADRDTLHRLPTQVVAYNAIFEFAWVVTTPAHLAGVRAIVPAWWGLLVTRQSATGEPMLVRARAAKANKARRAEHLARLLWRDEAMALLESRGLAKGLRSKPKIALYAALAASTPLPELADHVRECLKARQNWRP